MLLLIMTILFGWTGIYRFSKRQISLGIVYLLTFGLFFAGWVYDIYCAAKDIKTPETKSGKHIIEAIGFVLFLLLLGLSSWSRYEKPKEPNYRLGNSTARTTAETVSELTSAAESVNENVTENPTENSTKTPSENSEETQTESTAEQEYILNTNTMKFHKTTCKSAESIKPENKQAYSGTRGSLIEQGYSPCGNCDP